MNGSVNRDFLTWSHATFFWYKFKSTPVVSQDDCRITATGITAICYEWIRLNTCYVSNTSLGVQAVSGCQPCPLGPLSSFLPLVCIVSPICGPLHVALCTSECMCDARLWGFFFFFHIFHVGLSHIMLALPLTLLLCLIHRGTHTRNTQSGQGLWTEPTGRLVSRLLCCLSWAVLVMSAFEVDADSWMEELRAPMVEEKAQGNISEPRLDMAMRVYTLTHTYTVSTGSLHCRDSKKKKEKKKKTPTTKKLNPTE